jgi:hypothetical protein
MTVVEITAGVSRAWLRARRVLTNRPDCSSFVHLEGFPHPNVVFLCSALEGLIGQSFVVKVDIFEVVEAVVGGFGLYGVRLSTFVVAHREGLYNHMDQAQAGKPDSSALHPGEYLCSSPCSQYVPDGQFGIAVAEVDPTYWQHLQWHRYRPTTPLAGLE